MAPRGLVFLFMGGLPMFCKRRMEEAAQLNFCRRVRLLRSIMTTSLLTGSFIIFSCSLSTVFLHEYRIAGGPTSLSAFLLLHYLFHVTLMSAFGVVSR